ncbi:uncharacterized protein KY384_008823 [Bacidia gigantensis]|uniref:uncharacterized protein n=1 Tax=Bacidia gigantensis TaxID=2732470 RepID=UPI001D05860D|nr:uncharacterized protein KY384_008823 [Bacidia gigantensis]KAG8526622.1 hypothetical protein KY384_008823 [Bacidia gigantensis]
MKEPYSYSLHVDEELLRTTKEKLRLARFPEELEDLGDDDWSHGAKVKEVKRLAQYWLDGFDWRAQEAAINADFRQWKVEIDVPDYGPHTFHYVHEPSLSSDAIPLLFVAGWPGSFLEARELIKPLISSPNDNTPAFHIVIASLPGFGPGDAPKNSGFSPSKTAMAFKTLMVDVLGYRKFVTQGGDFGSWVTRIMAHMYPEHVRACHTNFMVMGPPPFYKNPLVFGRLILNSVLYTKKEQKMLEKAQSFMKEHMAYAMVQGTKPQSLAFGLGDSPIGLLAWFLEKYHAWTDNEHYSWPDDQILTFVMMHWMQGATPGFRYYKESFQEKGPYSGLNVFGKWCDVPTGYSEFPKETTSFPLDWIRTSTNLQWFREHDRGGHFAAVEQPELLVQDMREWFGSQVVREAMR